MKATLGHAFKGSYHDPDGNSFSFSPGSETFGICQFSKKVADECRLKVFTPPLPRLSRTPNPDARPLYPNLVSPSIFEISMLPVVHVRKQYDSSYSLVAELQNTKFAVVPVHTKEERQLFKSILDNNSEFSRGKEPNWDHFCIVWSYRCNTQALNGNLFYKTPYHLKMYYNASLAFKIEKVSVEVVNHSSVQSVITLTASENRPAIASIPPSEASSFSTSALGPFPSIPSSGNSASLSLSDNSRKRRRTQTVAFARVQTIAPAASIIPISPGINSNPAAFTFASVPPLNNNTGSTSTVIAPLISTTTSISFPTRSPSTREVITKEDNVTLPSKKKRARTCQRCGLQKCSGSKRVMYCHLVTKKPIVQDEDA